MGTINSLQTFLPKSVIEYELLPFMITKDSFYEAAAMLSYDLMLYVRLVEEGHISFTEDEFHKIKHTCLSQVIGCSGIDKKDISLEEKTKRQIEFIDFLVKKGTNVNGTFYKSCTVAVCSREDTLDPLDFINSLFQQAIYTKQLHLARHLVQLGANPNADEDNALMVAITHSYLEAVIYLHEECKADLNVHDFQPMYTALRFYHGEILAYLLKCGAKLRIMDDDDFEDVLQCVMPFTGCSNECLLDINRAMMTSEENNAKE